MYYVLEPIDPKDGFMALLDYRSDHPRRSWTRGNIFRNLPPVPVKAKLVMREKSMLLELWVWPVPLMTKRLCDLLIRAGATNLQIFPAELHDPVSGTIYNDYVAFNLINNQEGDPCSTVFRHENHGIVVHESVKKIIESSGINSLSFIKADL